VCFYSRKKKGEEERKRERNPTFSFPSRIKKKGGG
jgi:hypothetical protein